LVSHWLQFETDEPFVPDLDKFGFVYLITNTQTRKKYVGCKQYYIGKAKKESKWETYMGSSKYLKEDIKKRGKKHFMFEAIAEYINKRSLRYYEAYYQLKWNVLASVIEGTDEPAFYNSYVGGKFYRPVESYQDPEWKRKISKSQKGVPKSEEHKKNLRKPKSEEHKKNISKANKGIPKSEEHKKNMSKPKSEETKKKMRKPKSEEHKKNMSKAQKGVPKSEEHKKNISKGLLTKRIRRKEETNGN
jgi:hypothetical protein